MAEAKKKAARKKSAASKKKVTTRKSKAVAGKKTAVKKAPAKKRSARKTGAGERIARVTPEERWKMIAEAAYYLAEQRGFRGDTVDDWLEAERTVDAQLADD